MDTKIQFLREMPLAPEERGTNTLVPFWLFEKEIGEFIPVFNVGKEEKDQRAVKWSTSPTGSLIRPDIGEFEHYAKVRLDAEGHFLEYVDDHIEWSNGPLDMRTHLAKPNAVTAPILFKDGEYWVLWFWAWREATWDDRWMQVPDDLHDRAAVELFIAQHRGVWYPTVPGGWAKKGETSIQAAQRESREELAIRFLELNQIGRIVQDRSNGQTLVSIGYTTFEFVEGLELTKDEGELVKGKFATPIGKFRTEDGLVMAAINFAREELGLISSSPINK
jgi:8-oxo-dGTP pyrophosphatase MutT (NUDIX family)